MTVAGVDVLKTDMVVGTQKMCRDDRGQGKSSSRHSLGRARVTGGCQLRECVGQWTREETELCEGLKAGGKDWRHASRAKEFTFLNQTVGAQAWPSGCVILCPPLLPGSAD